MTDTYFNLVLFTVVKVNKPVLGYKRLVQLPLVMNLRSNNLYHAERIYTM